MSTVQEVCTNYRYAIREITKVHEGEVDQLKAIIKSLEDKLSNTNQLNQSTNPFEDKAKNEALSRLNVLENELMTVKSELNETKANLETSEARRKSVWKKHDNLQIQVGIIRDTHTQELAELTNSKDVQIAELNNQIKALEANVAQLTESLKKAETNGNSSDCEIEKLVHEVDMLTVGKSIMEQRCADYQTVIKKLTEEKEKLAVSKSNHINTASAYKFIEKCSPDEFERSIKAPRTKTETSKTNLDKSIVCDGHLYDIKEIINGYYYKITKFYNDKSFTNVPLIFDALYKYIESNNSIPERIIVHYSGQYVDIYATKTTLTMSWKVWTRYHLGNIRWFGDAALEYVKVNQSDKEHTLQHVSSESSDFALKILLRQFVDLSKSVVVNSLV